MTTQTMTKEQILESRISCTCDEAYKSRKMADPDCGRCNWYEEILSCMSEWESQQLSAERERYDQLKAKYDALVMDNATLEYNAAEAEKHLPDVIKQFVDQERERAAKLVSGLNELKEDMELDGYVNYSNEIDILITNYEQTLNEYDTATKES